jgi:RNA methyltransferase, TrmH family
MKQITSADNAQFRMLLKLTGSSRQRRLAGQSLLDGVHLLQAYIQRLGMPQQLIVSEGGAANPEIQATLAQCANVPQIVLSDRLFQQLSTVETPTGILALITTPQHAEMPEVFGSCVMLEDIQDPGNLGSILRSCAAAAVRQVFLSTDSVNAWSPRVLRAGMGAHFSLQIYERVDLLAIVAVYPGRVLVTHQLGTSNVYQSDLRGNVALVFGNEGAGVSQELQQHAHASISIPMSGATESLNVAAAAAVCLFERVRQLGQAEY